MKFTILVDPFLVIITLFLIYLIHAPVYTRREEDPNIAFSLYGHAPTQELLWGHEILHLGRLFLAHHYCTFSLSDLCLGKEKLLKLIMHFHCMIYMVTP